MVPGNGERSGILISPIKSTGSMGIAGTFYCLLKITSQIINQQDHFGIWIDARKEE